MRAGRVPVLVIDDERDILEMVSFALPHEDFEVATALGGAAAIEAASARRFAIAVTDLKMPGMDGLTTIRALKRIDADLEIVVATGYGTVETALECLREGAFDYIHKPFEIGELVLVLERALAQRALARVEELHAASVELIARPPRQRVLQLAALHGPRVVTAELCAVMVGDELVRSTVNGPTDDELRAHAACRAEPLRTTRLEGETDFAALLVVPLTPSPGALVLLRRAPFADSDAQRAAVLAALVGLALT